MADRPQPYTNERNSLMTDALNKIQALEKERQRLRLGGGPSEIEKQHKKGKLTARERVEKLLDPGTFYELELWAKGLRTGYDIDERELAGDAVAIGYGQVEGRTVMVYAHDFTVAGGTQAAVQHSKVVQVMDTAVKMGVPYIGIVDSGAIRIQDFMGYAGWKAPMGGYGMGGSGSIMYSPPQASGVVPQVSLMLGPNYAGSCYSPILADFLIMRQGPSFMSLVSPSVIKEVTHAEVTQEEIGGAMLHAEVSGTCDLVVQSDEEGLEKCRRLLGYLPLNNRAALPVKKTGDDPFRKDESLLEMVSDDPNGEYDMRVLLARVADKDSFFEVKPLYAKSVIIGFARLDGQPVGIVANNPNVMHGAFDLNASDKAARFIRFCDAFNIPLVFFVDTVGFAPGMENVGLARHAAMVPYAICEATVPKITVHVRNCSGAGEYMMGTAQMGANLVLAWPTAHVGEVDAEAAADEIFRNELGAADKELRLKKVKEIQEKYNNIFNAGARQLVQDIIDPRDTRAILNKALGWFAGKKDDKPWDKRKKHGNMPL